MSLTPQQLNDVIGHANNSSLDWEHKLKLDNASFDNITQDASFCLRICSSSAQLEDLSTDPIAIISVEIDFKLNKANAKA